MLSFGLCQRQGNMLKAEANNTLSLGHATTLQTH